MNGGKPAGSDVGEREIRSEKGSNAGEMLARSGHMRVPGLPICCVACLLAANWLLPLAPLATSAALNADHAGLLFVCCRRIH